MAAIMSQTVTAERRQARDRRQAAYRTWWCSTCGEGRRAPSELLAVAELIDHQAVVHPRPVPLPMLSCEPA